MNEKHKELKELVNLNHSELEELEVVGQVFALLEEKGLRFIEELNTKQMVLNVVGAEIYMDCKNRILYGLKESIDYIDKENKFDEFRNDLIEIFQDMLDKLKNYDIKVNSYVALTLISDFNLDIFNRILKYNMWRFYLIMAEYKRLNILFPSNFNSIREDEFNEYFKKL